MLDVHIYMKNCFISIFKSFKKIDILCWQFQTRFLVVNFLDFFKSVLIRTKFFGEIRMFILILIFYVIEIRMFFPIRFLLKNKERYLEVLSPIFKVAINSESKIRSTKDNVFQHNFLFTLSMHMFYITHLVTYLFQETFF